MNTAEMPHGDAVLELLTGAEHMFNHVLGDVEPYHEPQRLVHLLFFRRFTELQYHIAGRSGPSLKPIAGKARYPCFAASSR